MAQHITLNTPFPFGKYKGQPLQAALADADYMRWVMSQADIADRHPDLFEFLVNGPLKGTQDTEQHNRMQVRLLDKKEVAKVLTSAFKTSGPLEIASVRFEVFNWDAVVTTRNDMQVAIELKPTISEDYPAVLRQVTNRMQVDRASRRTAGGYGLYSHVLVLTNRIAARSATNKQIEEMFAASNIKMHEWATDDFDDLTVPQGADLLCDDMSAPA